MKAKNVYAYKSGNQIWRLLISENDYLLIEARDTDKKEAFFNCIDLSSMKNLFTNIQFKENYWIGVEKFYKNILLLHGYGKPDMPGHKGIIAYDVIEKKIVWQNNDLSFLFLFNDNVYAYIQQFEGRVYYKIDLASGDKTEKLELTNDEINSLRQKSMEAENYSNYIFPEFLNLEDSNDKAKNIISKEIGKKNLVGETELAIKNDFLCFNFHYKSTDGSLINQFYCYNSRKGKSLFSEILNKGVSFPAPDSFFIYKNLLLFIRDKSEVCIYQLED